MLDSQTSLTCAVDIRSVLIPSPYSEGTKRGAISIFLACGGRTPAPRMREGCSRARFPSCNVLKQKRTATNGLDEKTPLTSASANSVFRNRLACETKEQRQRRLQLRREARREQSRWAAEERSQETQKRLKAERQRDASRHQCQTAEQRAHRLLDNQCSASWNEPIATTTQPATRRCVQKWHPWGHFLCCWKNHLGSKAKHKKKRY